LKHHRGAKDYRVTRVGVRALDVETARWRRLVRLVEKLLLSEG
jgi:hypothetical protein